MEATQIPSRVSGGWFAAKRLLLQTRRLLQDTICPPKRFRAGESPLPKSFERRTRLYTEADPAEQRLQLGKVQNLRLAAKALNGIEVPAGETFSFWKHVGRCTRARGYVPGRQIQEGCLMPAIGGGICQLTNALYALALEAGLEIVERHPHTRAVPGATGPDATVAWNYIDLRFRSARPFRIEIGLTGDELLVRLRTTEGRSRMQLPLVDSRTKANSCATCGQEQCHHWHEVGRVKATRTAWLVDQWLPEYEAAFTEADLLFRPLDGRRWKRPQYAWPDSPFQQVQDFTLIALRRGLRQRRLAEQGAARQRALLEASEELANAYARRLPFDVSHLVVSQGLLPFLWKSGVLGGRTFDVLMTRMPMAEIHRRLDEVAAAHPERRLLSDFRAPYDLIEGEGDALAASSRQFTAHTELCRILTNPVQLDWPSVRPLEWTPGKAIVFPGPTAARKGAYEVREAAKALDVEVILLGSELEGADFWDGVRTRRAGKGDKLEGVLAVIQPAILEDRPMFLLRALAAGCPVIATAACGLPSHPLVMVVDVDSPDALIEAIRGLSGGAQ